LEVFDWKSNANERLEVGRLEQAKYIHAKLIWTKILKDAGASPLLTSHDNAPVGDEAEGGDVVQKIKERKYRIGTFGFL
jgi:hypothetical protein